MARKPMTEKEASETRIRLAEYDNLKRAEEDQARADEEAAAQEARNAKLAPLRAIVDQDAFSAIANDLRDLVPAFIGDEPLFPMIKALADVMPQLKDWAAK
ncbi:hypothetical protein BH11PSE5_BH11PSE5_20880 [soil metagenome]